MEWYLAFLVILGGVIFFMATGMPVAFCFMVVNVIAVIIWWGGEPGLEQLILNLYDSVTTFGLLPLPLFLLMGAVTFESNIAPFMIDALDNWLGRLPGRLSLLSVGAGTVLSTLTGDSMSSTAMLGKSLIPEMERKGYKTPMSIGPILGSGGLAMMIPPSGLAVFLGAVAQISVGGILIAIVIPGLLMAIFYATYVIIRCRLQPSLGPVYESPHISLSKKLTATACYILPLGFIVFMVIGLIILGVATPSEAAATGALSTFLLAFAYRRLNWEVVKKSIISATEISAMVLMIIVGAKAFAQILAYSGASRGFIEFVLGFGLAPIYIFISLQIIILLLGMFMNTGSIIMITIPLFMPIVDVLAFEPLWFAAAFLLCLEMSQTTPPFGMILFVMKGVAPRDTTMGDIYKAGLPFLGCDALVLALMIAFPVITLWLPSMMR